MIAEGRIITMSRNVQSVFKVQLSNTYLGSEEEPMATYIYPRENLATETLGAFFGPLNLADWNLIMSQTYGAGTIWGTTDQLYDHRIQIGYKARYQIRNNTGYPGKYEVLVFKWRKDVPNFNQASFTYPWDHPLNVAGAYLEKQSDIASNDLENADNKGLHTERIKLENIPPIRQYLKLIKKKYFVLGPGAIKTHILKKKLKTYRLSDAYNQQLGSIVSQPQPIWTWRKGNILLFYKSISDPSALVAADTNPLTVNTTRTTPVTLLSYQCNYFTRHESAILPDHRSRHVTLTTIGYKDNALEADIANIGDDDMKVVVQRSEV